jgi:hypothetical protein
MVDHKVEIIFIAILIIAVSSLIGLNIIRVVERKLNNIEVKLPKMTVPESNVTVSLIDKNGATEIKCIHDSSKVRSQKNKEQSVNYKCDKELEEIIELKSMINELSKKYKKNDVPTSCTRNYNTKDSNLDTYKDLNEELKANLKNIKGYNYTNYIE